MLGWGWGKVHNPEMLPRVLKKWKETLAAGTPWQDEFQLKSKTGEYPWFLSRARPLKNSSGEITGWFGTNTDIEDTTKLQRELVDTIESMNDSFATIDKNWNITMVNSKTEALSKLSREEQVGKNLLELYYPNNSWWGTAAYKFYTKSMTERVPSYFEEYYNPLELWIVTSVIPKADGGIAIFGTDITQNKNPKLK